MNRILSIALCGALGVASFTSREGTASAAPAVASAASLDALRQELAKADGAVQPLRARLGRLADEAGHLAQAIDEAKRRPEGVARDRDLQALLSRSKGKTDELERVQAELRWREPGLTELRRRVVRAVDALLDGGQSLPDATRLDLERLRVASVALLASPSLPLSVVTDPKASIADPLDGPRELREKADLLRDSGDKLRREARRIAGRVDGVERRRKLRERSGALDEDLFGENTSNRRIARVGEGGNPGTTTSFGSGKGDAIASTNPSTVTGPVNPGVQGATGDVNPVVTGPATVLRNLVDPATLDELRRADAGDDADRQTRALKRAQQELETLAAELDRRAKALDGRARQLKHEK